MPLPTVNPSWLTPQGFNPLGGNSLQPNLNVASPNPIQNPGANQPGFAGNLQGISQNDLFAKYEASQGYPQGGTPAQSPQNPGAYTYSGGVNAMGQQFPGFTSLPPATGQPGGPASVGTSPYTSQDPYGTSNLPPAYQQYLQLNQQLLPRLLNLQNSLLSAQVPTAQQTAVQDQILKAQNQIAAINPQSVISANPGLTGNQLNSMVATQQTPIQNALNDLLIQNSVLGEQQYRNVLQNQVGIGAITNQLSMAGNIAGLLTPQLTTHYQTLGTQEYQINTNQFGQEVSRTLVGPAPVNLYNQSAEMTGGTGSTLDPNNPIDAATQNFMSTGEMPRSISGNLQAEQMVTQRANEISMATTGKPFDQAQAQAAATAKEKYAGLTPAALGSALTQQTDYLNTTQRAFNTANDTLNALTSWMGQNGINASQFPDFNSFTNYLKSKGIDPGAAGGYNAQIATLRTEYAQVLSRGGQVTDTARNEANQLIPDGLAPAQLQVVADRLKVDATNVVNDAQNQINVINAQIQKTNPQTQFSGTNNLLGMKVGTDTQYLINSGLAQAGGAAQDGGNFLAFKTPADSIEAAHKLLLTDYGDMTINAAMKKWSNNGYDGQIIQGTVTRSAPKGMDPNALIRDLPDDQMTALLSAMVKKEGVK